MLSLFWEDQVFFWQRKKDNFEKMIASKLSSVNETLYYFLPSTAGKKYFLPLNVHRSCPQIYKKPEYQTLKSVYANNTKIGQKTCSIKGTKTICIFGSHSITIFFCQNKEENNLNIVCSVLICFWGNEINESFHSVTFPSPPGIWHFSMENIFFSH